MGVWVSPHKPIIHLTTTLFSKEIVLMLWSYSCFNSEYTIVS